MELRFDGLTIIVTGGGTGIGRAIAQSFAAGGGSVIVNYRKSEKEARQTVADIEHTGGQAKAVQADVTQWEDVTRMIDQARATFGSVDILVNNAGGNIEKHPVAEYPPDIWDRTVDLNLNSVFLCCKAAIPFLPNQTGRIINITSISAVTGGGTGGVAYGAAKAGVITFTRNLAHELAPRGITVNAVAPGIIDTRIHQQFTSPEDYETLIARVPLGRDGKPADTAGITLLLASQQGSYITGQTVHVNGGLLMVDGKLQHDVGSSQHFEDIALPLTITDLERRIWDEELAEVLPEKIFDAHAHLYRPEHNLDRSTAAPESNEMLKHYTVLDRNALGDIYGKLFPGREVHSLCFGWVLEQLDFDAINAFVAGEVAADPLSIGFLTIPPDMNPDKLAEQVDRYHCRGLKPYFFWTSRGYDAEITDIIPEPLIEVANQKKLAVTLHFGKAQSIADENNISEMQRLAEKYPEVRWILAHAARSCVAWPLERAIERISDLPNLWYDVSSVVDTHVYSLLFDHVPLDRILYGSDIPSDLVRGNMIGFGYGWALVNEQMIRQMNIKHTDSQPTFVLYETLRAACRPIRRYGFDRKVVQAIFFDNATKLFDLPGKSHRPEANTGTG